MPSSISTTVLTHKTKLLHVISHPSKESRKQRPIVNSVPPPTNRKVVPHAQNPVLGCDKTELNARTPSVTTCHFCFFPVRNQRVQNLFTTERAFLLSIPDASFGPSASDHSASTSECVMERREVVRKVLKFLVSCW